MPTFTIRYEGVQTVVYLKNKKEENKGFQFCNNKSVFLFILQRKQFEIFIAIFTRNKLIRDCQAD
ncbi:MAG TPA: hypothetical protein DDZ57_10865 [Porphyromonadaceae bacterium]|jgi:hypothetical protein|nr:hypothetical protein [Porphyromonadaceae bacterium]